MRIINTSRISQILFKCRIRMKLITKFYLVLYVIVISNYSIFSQDVKRNSNWVVGYIPVVTFNFNTQLQISQIPHSGLPTPFCLINSGASCISDTGGVLSLFSNGYILYDKDGYLIENGYNVNCPKGQQLSDYYGQKSLFSQTSIILPQRSNRYYVFSTGMSDSAASNYLNHVITEFDILNYSIVDMDSNGGKGKVVEKNKILLENQHYTNCALTAVRHGNGKDWWLVKADCVNRQYQFFHVSADTILGPYIVASGIQGDFCVFPSQLCFSDDGTKMASSIFGSYKINGQDTFYYWNRVELYDFNRCNGSLTFRHSYEVPCDTINYPIRDTKMGISFSPDGKLLYMSTIYSIYQIDVEDTSTNNAMLISGPDTSLTEFPWYDVMACGADGKLYIGNSGGNRKSMSYIEFPNVRGSACQFVPQGIWQPYTNLLSPPNMPNYGLGVDTAHGCWPLGTVNEILPSKNLLVYPNPAQHSVTIECKLLSSETAQFNLFDILGNKVISTNLNGENSKTTLDIHHLAQGVYSYQIVSSDAKVVTGKLIKD